MAQNGEIIVIDDSMDGFYRPSVIVNRNFNVFYISSDSESESLNDEVITISSFCSIEKGKYSVQVQQCEKIWL